jgi:SMI1 / KNR4 family (SUKH-1)
MSATRLRDELIRLGATPNPPATAAMIADSEQRLGIRFPPAIAEFYRVCDGLSAPTSEWTWDFFPLERVERLSDYRRHAYDQLALYNSTHKVRTASLITFCDVMIDAPTYAYCIDESTDTFGCFFADQGGDGWRVSDSFSQFVDVFLAQNDDLLLSCN